MADQRDDGSSAPAPEGVPLLVVPETSPEESAPTETIQSPAKVLRIGSMVKELLEEVRRAPLDETGRARMKEIYETSVRELADGVSDDLREELARVTFPFSDEIPSGDELRVAQAQLVGWLEGLFHGIQAAMFAAQQMAMGRMGGPGGPGPRGLPTGPGGQPPGTDFGRPGNYL